MAATLILSEIENAPKGTADAYRTNRNEQEEFRYLGYDGGRLVGGAVSSPPMRTLCWQRIPWRNYNFEFVHRPT